MDLDSELGIWFEGVVYFFDDNTRKWVNVNAHVCRCITNKLSLVAPKYSKMFAKANENPYKQYFCQGRHWYQGPFSYVKSPVLVYSKGLSREYEKLRLIESRPFSLATLICGSYGDDPFEDLLKGDCTPIGDRIARSLIRTAATRIFNDPEQSIMELPVNSVDSYYPDRSVGKFGMGFFSILYWLIGTERTLSITSFCLDSKDKSYAYEVVIFFDGELKFKVHPFVSYTTLTGSRIIMDCENKYFSQDELKKFQSYADRLNYIKGVKIGNNLVGWNSKAVFLNVYPDGFTVEDYAAGISSDVLLTKLFIPSMSTKTIQGSLERGDDIPPQAILNNDTPGGLFITVNDVVLKSYTFEKDAIHYGNGSYKMVGGKFQFLWNLPRNTKVPVSRDDVILDKEVTRATLIRLFEQAVQINKAFALQHGLMRYSEDTSYSNSVIVKDILLEVAHIYRDVFVDVNSDVSLFYPNAVKSFYYDREQTRETFVKNLRSDYRATYLGEVFYGKEVFAVDTSVWNHDIPMSTSYVDVMVVSKKIISEKDWQTVLSATYFKQGKLIPEGMAIPSGIVLNNPRSNALLNTFVSLINSLNMTKSVIINTPTESVIAEFVLYLFGDTGVKILNELNASLSNYEPNFSYGKKEVSIWPEIPPKDFNFDKDSNLYRLAHECPRYCSFVLEFFVGCMKMFKPDDTTWLWLNIFDVRKLDICKFVAENVSSYLHYIYLIYFCNLTTNYIENITPVFDVINEKVKFMNPSIKELKSLVYYYTIDPRNSSAKSFIDTLITKKTPKLSQYVLDSLPGQEISNATLIAYMFDNPNKITFKDLSSISSWIPKRKMKLQTLEIAVNEGTTKPFIEAAITECFQNSVDAIRKGNPSTRIVRFRLSSYDEHLVLTIQDYVGMSVESFLYISVPFLSTKDNSDPAYTGEMGTGFFNVYRESSMVRILTRPPGDENTYVWEDTPVRDRGRVVDIKKKFSVSNRLLTQGTLIEIHMPYSKIKDKTTVPPEKDFADMVQISDIVSKRLSYTLLDVRVMLNDEDLTQKAKFIHQFGKVQFYYIEDEGFTSFIYTNGVPFTPVPGLLGYAQAHVIINLLPGAYVPRQSRTHIDFGEHANDFENARKLAYAYTNLKLVFEGKTYMDMSFASSSDVEMSLPKNEENDNPVDILTYKIPKYGSVAKALWEGARVCEYQPYDTFQAQKLREWADNKYGVGDSLGDFIKEYVLRWLFNKTTRVQHEQQEQDLKSSFRSEPLSILTDLYVKIAKELGIRGFDKKITAIAPTGTGRSFSVPDKDIIVIYGALDETVEEEFRKGFNSYTFLIQGRWVDLYGPVGSFTHEMEHIRRKDSTQESDGHHNEVEGPLWTGDSVSKRSFGQCQLDVYTKIVRDGKLWQKFDKAFTSS